MIVLKLIFKNLRRNKKNNFIFSLSILIVILFILSFNSYAELNNIDLDRSLVYNSDINIYGANYSSFESFNTDYSGDNNNNNNIHYINLDKSVLTQLSSNNLQELKNLSNMAKISPLYSFPDKTNISSNFKILAFNSNDYGAIGINITEGALFNNSNEIILSDSLKNKFHLKIGDSIKIANSSYYCTGFFSSNYILNDYGLMSHEGILKLNDSCHPVIIKNILLTLEDSSKINDVSLKLDDLDYKYSSKGSLSEDFFINLVNVYFPQITYVLGAIIIFYGVFSSISFRSNEIAIFMALGWKKKYILFYFLLEYLLISLITLFLGIISLILLIKILCILMNFSFVYKWDMILNLIVNIFIMTFIGGIYPLISATLLSNKELLRN